MPKFKNLLTIYETICQNHKNVAIYAKNIIFTVAFRKWNSNVKTEWHALELKIAKNVLDRFKILTEFFFNVRINSEINISLPIQAQLLKTQLINKCVFYMMNEITNMSKIYDEFS